jgi:lipid II:glycine glycyltransferase (peptidoglycan interpeptide bridge formation enzyme)|tara:strand:- start:511 stop:1482 length:972 start_codon:yes stop_codon:yes gene_type:complete
MNNKFKFIEINKSTWNSCIDQIDFTNLSQNYEYGVSKSKNENWSQTNYLIKSEKGENLAIIQILKKRFLFLDVFRVNRGPLIFTNMISDDYKYLEYEILNILKSKVTNNLFSLFLIAPEIENKDFQFSKLNFFKRRNKIAYGSSKMNLEQNEEDLLMSINPKWRNLLKKSHKMDIIVEESEINKESIDFLINFYEKSQKIKNYNGVPGNVLRELAILSNKAYSFNYYISKSSENSEIIGVLVSVKHGNTSTYLLGATNELGRKFNANYAMLWNAIITSKKNGCSWFDLGGINENTTEGVKRFKTRLNGQNYSLIGEFWSFKIF